MRGEFTMHIRQSASLAKIGRFGQCVWGHLVITNLSCGFIFSEVTFRGIARFRLSSPWRVPDCTLMSGRCSFFTSIYPPRSNYMLFCPCTVSNNPSLALSIRRHSNSGMFQSSSRRNKGITTPMISNGWRLHTIYHDQCGPSSAQVKKGVRGWCHISLLQGTPSFREPHHFLPFVSPI